MKRILLVCMTLIAILTAMLAGCGEKPKPTVSPLPLVIKMSPLATPTTPSMRPTDTPDPSRTPLIIALVAVNEEGREVVLIKNIGPELLDLEGFSIYSPSQDRRFDFPPNFVLSPGESVAIYSGVAKEQVKDGFFWTRERLWIEENDDVLLLNPAGRVVFWYVFPGP